MEARLGSGIWTELDEQGNQHQLEAYALQYQNSRILLLVDLTASFDARHHVYQRAREIALAQERLVMSLQRQQRKLQLQIQGLLALENSFNRNLVGKLERMNAANRDEKPPIPDSTILNLPLDA